MTYEPNTNESRCPQTITGFGECCCNCKHRYKMIHTVQGFVGYCCKLNPPGEPTFISVISEHGMCEMHDFVGTVDEDPGSLEIE